MSGWFQHIEDDARHDWQRATQRFTHRVPIMSGNEPHEPQGVPSMPLADTHAGLQDRSNSIHAGLQAGLTALHEVADDHMSQLDALIGEVGQIAQIADHPLVVAAAGALHVPPPVLDGFITGLSALAKAFPQTEPAPAPEPPAEPQPEPQSEQSAA